MSLVSVAVDYIEIHRADSSDAEISRALKAQGFSRETLSAAFRAAGARAARRALVALLLTISALLFVGSALLFVRNFRQAGRVEAGATEAGSPR
jgi:hypothetical protein